MECEEVVMQRKDKERVRKVRERAGEMPEKTLLRRQTKNNNYIIVRNAFSLPRHSFTSNKHARLMAEGLHFSARFIILVCGVCVLG